MAKLEKRAARHKRRAQRTARELAIARSKPPPSMPELPAHISKDRPPPGCELIPGTGWPLLIDASLSYRQQLAGIPGEWTAWTDYKLDDGRTMTVFKSFPDGAEWAVVPSGDGSWAWVSRLRDGER